MVPPTAGWNLPCQSPMKTILTDMATGQSDQGEFSVEIPSFLSCVKLEIKVNRGNLPPVNFEYWENISSERT